MIQFDHVQCLMNSAITVSDLDIHSRPLFERSREELGWPQYTMTWFIVFSVTTIQVMRW